MSKPYHNLTLAKSPTEWRQLGSDVTRLVDELCDFGDYDKAKRLFSLLDLLTNYEYNQQHREILTHTAIRRAFTMTEACKEAMEAEARKQNPVPLKRTA